VSNLPFSVFVHLYRALRQLKLLQIEFTRSNWKFNRKKLK
jgi:hypothetical protein